MLPLLFFLEVFTSRSTRVWSKPVTQTHLHLDLRAGLVRLEVGQHTQIQIYNQIQRVPHQ